MIHRSRRLTEMMMETGLIAEPAEEGGAPMYDLIIIGGGPAGLTAAVYAIRKRLNCVLVSPDLGGKANARMHIEGVDTFNVINGADLVRRFRNEIEYLDFARILEPATKIEKTDGVFLVTTESGKCLEARAVILATGADAVRLDVPGADQYWLKGVAYSTVSYAPLYIDKTVALVGSGPLALRGAAELAQIVKQLYLVAPDAWRARYAGGPPRGWTRRMSSCSRTGQPVAVEGDVYARRLDRPSARRLRAQPGGRRHLRRTGAEAAQRAGAGLDRHRRNGPCAGQLRHGDHHAGLVRGRRRDPTALPSRCSSPSAKARRPRWPRTST